MTGDREFIGYHWFEWLVNHDIPFDIRIKSNTQINQNGKEFAVKDLFVHLRRGQFRQPDKLYTIFGCDVYISGRTSKKTKVEKMNILLLLLENTSLAQISAIVYVENRTTFQRTKK